MSSYPERVQVVAPADLEAGHTIFAMYEGTSFTAVVPDGGVTQGQRFIVPFTPPIFEAVEMRAHSEPNIRAADARAQTSSDTSILSCLSRTFLGRRDEPPEGEIRVALNPSKRMMSRENGYFFMKPSDSGHLGYPPPAVEHVDLYAVLEASVLAQQKAYNRKALPWILLLLVPFIIMLVVGDNTEGLDGSPYQNLFLVGFVVSLFLPALLISGPCLKLPLFKRLDQEKRAELETIVNDQAQSWSTETEYRLTLEEDTAFPPIVYLCFRKVGRGHASPSEAEGGGEDSAQGLRNEIV